MSQSFTFKVGDRVICHGHHGTIADRVSGWYRVAFDGPELGPRVANYWGAWEMRPETKVK